MQDLGHVLGVMHGQDAVVHLAAIPAPGHHPSEMVFRNNVMSTFNVLEAATLLNVRNLVLASSISALGLAYRHRDFNPLRIPVDETHPLLSQDCYGLSKTGWRGTGRRLRAAHAGAGRDQSALHLGAG